MKSEQKSKVNNYFQSFLEVNKHDPLLICVVEDLADKESFDYLFEVYKDTGDIISGAELFSNGCIGFFHKNKKEVMVLAQELASEVNEPSIANYLHNTMDSLCSLNGIQLVLDNEKEPSANDIINDEEEAFYIVSEWLSRATIMNFMDKLSEHQRVKTGSLCG